MKFSYRVSEPTSRDLKIYDELCNGQTLRDVGTEFGLHHRTVMRIRDKVELWLHPEMENHLFSTKQQQEAKLHRDCRNYMAAWEKSKTEPLVTKKVSKNGKTTITKLYLPGGDPRILHKIFKTMAEIRKVWNTERHNKESTVPECLRRMRQALN